MKNTTNIKYVVWFWITGNIFFSEMNWWIDIDSIITGIEKNKQQSIFLFFQSNGITEAIYMSDWYTYETSSRKILILIMERAKKPLVQSAGNVSVLSLPLFVSVHIGIYKGIHFDLI